MTNRLAGETSPYLQQHANNPVDWYPWGDEALERARRERKPILLSIGYSACHWCHVMERESFEDAGTARIMNELFVNVKVDREERPDLDSIYMQAVQAMTGHGGWPMTTFLTPELEPFWAGTYFPPTDRPGMPSFKRVLAAVNDAWKNRPADVQRVATTMREMYDASRRPTSGVRRPDVDAGLLRGAAQALLRQYDAQNGGFGGAPKFPHPMAMEFLLTQWARTGDVETLEAVRHTFVCMARGGIYDQVGGGFARYSVDDHWLVPHFEKMLYDNALLTRIGVHLWQATKEPEIKRICVETLEWLGREMTSKAGGFYSTLDADSEGEEGKFYLWDEGELRNLLRADADALIAHWGVTADGNFEGRNILNCERTWNPELGARLERARQVLYEVRSKRVWPARDEKIIASWNGLMLRAVCAAARAFESNEYRRLAVQNGEFLFREIVRDGRVFRTHKDGVSRVAGFLEDHAAVALGALALYELTFEASWLARARELAGSIVRWFWDDKTSTLFDTATDHERLLTRPSDITDNATPSGTSLAVDLFLRLGDLLEDNSLAEVAQRALAGQREQMERFPLAFGQALTAADMLVFGATEVAIAGKPGTAGFQSLESALGGAFVPGLVVAGGVDANVPLLEGKTPEHGTVAYVCRDRTCGPPLSSADELRAELSAR